MNKGKQIVYVSGQLINGYTFLSQEPNILVGKSSWRAAKFRCPCGNEFIRTIAIIKNQKMKSCLCNPKGTTKHGCAAKTPEYNSWLAMKSRCMNPNNVDYKRYGGRGISVCDRWGNSFENFISDMGQKPSKSHSLDRFPNKDGNYEPSNCRWATPKEQARNVCDNVNITFNGETLCVSAWAEKIGVPRWLLRQKLKSNSLEDSVRLLVGSI